MTPELLPSLIWFNVGLLLVLGLRVFWHRSPSPAQAYGLWILPVLLVVAAWLPIAPEMRVLQVAALPAFAGPAGTSVTELAQFSSWGVFSALFFWISVTGSLLIGLVMVRQHQNLQSRLAASPKSSDIRCPELTIRRAEFGPALVGIIKPTLILPHDFEVRFTTRQQGLAIAHEMAHWRARDLPVRTFAWCLVALQWWNPLAWWSLARFIDDQELANDARVLANCPGTEHDYAVALAQATSIPMPPLACAMQPTHPLLWRISMLTSHPAHPISRRWMTALTGVMLLSLAGLAMALDPVTKSGPMNPFTVALDVQIDEGTPSSFAVAGPAGEPMAATIDGDGTQVALEMTVKPTATAGHVLIEMSIHRDGKLIAEPALQVAIDGDGRIQAGSEINGRFEGIRLDLKVSEGLPEQTSSNLAQPVSLRFAEKTDAPPAWQSGMAWLYPETPEC